MEESIQESETVEKTRWEGNKIVGTENEKKKMKRAMNEMKKI